MRAFVHTNHQWVPLPTLAYYHCTYNATHWLAPKNELGNFYLSRDEILDKLHEVGLSVVGEADPPFVTGPNTLRFDQADGAPLQITPRHGRNTTDEDMDTWGYLGHPILDVKSAVMRTNSISATLANGDLREIPIVDGMLALDGRYFGEWRIEPTTTVTAPRAHALL